jgi:CheY-like chemotaxis protein
MKLLVVDDIRTNRLIVSRILERHGHEVKSVGSGAEAIAELAREDFDLVLMDIQMPELNGIETARMIRNSASAVRCPAIPILALSATYDFATVKDCLKVGINGCMPKPISPSVLIDMVEQYEHLSQKRC